MNLEIIKRAALVAKEFALKNSTTILTSVGIAGAIGTATSASIASIKSYKAIKEAEAPNSKGASIKLTPKEKVKLCCKYYIPTAILLAMTIGSQISVLTISKEEKKTLIASALTIADKSQKEIAKLKEEFGDEKVKEIEEKVIFDEIANTNSTDINPDWTFCRHGNTLCYDYYCGRFFYSDPSFLRSREGEINRLYLTEGVVYLDDIYGEIDLIGANRPWLARMVTWEQGDDVFSSGGTLSFIFTSALTNDNKPVLVVRMNRDPKLTNYDS